jgi:preprotein translocase subunit SecE
MKIVESFKESYNELVHKVSWPTTSELSNSAVVVMFASLLIALVILVMDFGFENIMRFFYEAIF